MKRFVIILFLIICFVQVSFSQSEFLNRGKSGYSGRFGFSTNREGPGLNFNAGYSYRGFIDANITYAKVNGGRIQGGVFSPSLTFYPIKQEDVENIPTLGISLGFSRYVSKTTATVIVPDTVIVSWRSYERITELTVSALKLGITAQRRTGYWKTFFFQPLLGAELTMTNAGWGFILRGGLSVGTRVVKGPLLILTPSIERQSGLTTFLLSFGAVF